MIKTISFTEYNIYKNKYKNSKISKVFSIAWGNSAEGKKYIERHSRIVKIATMGTMTLIALHYVPFVNVLYVYADIIGAKILGAGQRYLYKKLNNKNNLYKKNTSDLNYSSTSNKDLNFKILNDTMDFTDICQQITSSKEKGLEDAIGMIARFWSNINITLNRIYSTHNK